MASRQGLSPTSATPCHPPPQQAGPHKESRPGSPHATNPSSTYERLGCAEYHPDGGAIQAGVAWGGCRSMSARSISATGCPVSIAVELATARMMRAPSGSALAFCRSRWSSGSGLGIGRSTKHRHSGSTITRKCSPHAPNPPPPPTSACGTRSVLRIDHPAPNTTPLHRRP